MPVAPPDSRPSRPADLSGKYLYFGNLGVNERQYQSGRWVGLALRPTHDREIQHDAREPLPVLDDSVRKIQSQDVFEHIDYELLPPILDDIYRALVPGGVFRLSLPDYHSPYLSKRCVYDENGNVLADLRMGGTVAYNRETKQREVRFAPHGNSHVWFPTYLLVRKLVEQSLLRACREIHYYHYFLNAEEFVVEPIPEDEMFVMRAPPHDMRAGGKPLSIVVDFKK